MQAEWDEIEAYCNSNPTECESTPELPDGSMLDAVDRFPCQSEFWSFTGAILSTHGVVILGVAALAAAGGGVIAVGVVAGTVVAAAGGLSWSYSGALSLLSCKAQMMVPLKLD